MQFHTISYRKKRPNKNLKTSSDALWWTRVDVDLNTSSCSAIICIKSYSIKKKTSLSSINYATLSKQFRFYSIPRVPIIMEMICLSGRQNTSPRIQCLRESPAAGRLGQLHQTLKWPLPHILSLMLSTQLLRQIPIKPEDMRSSHPDFNQRLWLNNLLQQSSPANYMKENFSFALNRFPCYFSEEQLISGGEKR